MTQILKISVIFVISRSFIISGLNDFLKVKPPSKMLLKVLSHFEDYSLIVHFDAITGGDLGAFFGNDRLSGRPMYTFNYSEQIEFNRPMGYKYVNVIHLKNPFDYENYSSTDYVYGTESKDVVLFILEKFETPPQLDSALKLRKLWHMNGLKFAVSLLILDLETSRLFHCCFYCGVDTGVLKQIANGSKLPNLRRFINTWSNFNGHVFKIAYAHFPPFFWCEINENKCEPQGAESMVLRTISEYLNFTFDLIKYDSELNPRGQWRSMVEGAHFRRFDWAVGGISVSNERATSTDFTRYIKGQGFSFLYSTWDRPWLAVDNILLTFEWIVWLFLFIATICIAIFALFAGKILNKSSTVHFFGYLKIATLSILDQSTADLNARAFVTTSIKSAFLIWWLMVLILNTMYKSQLASSLIRPKYHEPDNVESLVEAGFKYRANKEDWSVLRENLVFSEDRAFADILKNINDDLDFCDSVYETIGQRVAVIDEEVPIQYDVYKHCLKNLSTEEFSRLRLVTQDIFSNTYHGWCMQMSTPFRLKFSRTIGRMDDNGLIQHWYASAYAFRLPRSNAILKRDTVSLKVSQIFPALLVYGCGISVGLVVFTYEFCFHSRCARFVNHR